MRSTHIYTVSAACGLVLILTVSMLYAADALGFRNYTLLLLAGTLIWFAGILAAGLTKRRSHKRGTTHT